MVRDMIERSQPSFRIDHLKRLLPASASAGVSDMHTPEAALDRLTFDTAQAMMDRFYITNDGKQVEDLWYKDVKEFSDLAADVWKLILPSETEVDTDFAMPRLQWERFLYGGRVIKRTPDIQAVYDWTDDAEFDAFSLVVDPVTHKYYVSRWAQNRAQPPSVAGSPWWTEVKGGFLDGTLDETKLKRPNSRNNEDNERMTFDEFRQVLALTQAFDTLQPYEWLDSRSEYPFYKSTVVPETKEYESYVLFEWKYPTCASVARIRDTSSGHFRSQLEK